MTLEKTVDPLDNVSLLRKQLSNFQKYHEMTRKILILCENGDFTRDETLEQFILLVSGRQQLIEVIESNKVSLPAPDNAGSIYSLKKDSSAEDSSRQNSEFSEVQKTLGKIFCLLKELYPLDQKVQEKMEKKLSDAKAKMLRSRESLKAHKAYYPQEKQHEGFFIESLVGEK